jgi:hypothetical protein
MTEKKEIFPDQPHWITIAIVIILISLLGFTYFGMNTRGTFRFHELPRFSNYHILAEAFLSGRLSLDIPVHPQRLKHKYPADPFLPYPIILDTIIFEGKTYFLQEPLPAVIRALALAVTGFRIPTGVMVIFPALGSFLLVGFMSYRIRRRFLPDSPVGILFLVWALFGLSGTQLYIVSRPVVYHEAIVWGGFFALCGTSLITLFLTGEPRFRLLAFAGGLFGAAIASRGTFIFYPACFFLALGTYFIVKGNPRGSIMLKLAAFSFPVAIFIVLILAYNYVRFGNPLDFGITHLCTLEIFFQYCCVEGGFFRAAHVPYNLYNWLLSVPSLTGKFPFIEYPYTASIHGSVLNVTEKVTSFFYMVPILVTTAASPWIARKMRHEPEFMALFAAFLLSAVTTFFFLSFFVLAVARYLYDFTPILFPIVFMSLATIWESCRGIPRRRELFYLIVGLLSIMHVIFGTALGLNGMLQP